MKNKPIIEIISLDKTDIIITSGIFDDNETPIQNW